MPPTTAVIVCGGGATRLDGRPKPLLELAGKPLIGHVIDRLAPQVDAIVLACSARQAASYRQFGWPVATDAEPGQGPLAGLAAALHLVRTPWLLLAPADVPFLPPDLVAGLASAGRDHGAAVARAGGRRQNLVMLLADRRAADLAAFFLAGGRAAKRWLDAESVPTVGFPADAFRNINTAGDLDAARRQASRCRLPGAADSRT